MYLKCFTDILFSILLNKSSGYITETKLNILINIYKTYIHLNKLNNKRLSVASSLFCFNHKFKINPI